MYKDMYVQVPLVSQNEACTLALALQTSRGMRGELNQLDIPKLDIPTTYQQMKRNIVRLKKNPTSQRGQYGQSNDANLKREMNT